MGGVSAPSSIAGGMGTLSEALVPVRESGATISGAAEIDTGGVALGGLVSAGKGSSLSTVGGC